MKNGKQHILGKGEDKTPKTPEWAAKICDVPAHTITALAREWASKKTMLACGAMYGTGGACREAYATEWARLMVLLMAMQGLGKPGVNVWGGVAMGAPLDFNFKMPGYASAGWDAFATVAKKPAFPGVNKVTQKVWRISLAGSYFKSARSAGSVKVSAVSTSISNLNPLPIRSRDPMALRSR